MPIQYLSDGNPSGTVIAKSATDLLSIYAGTPAAQPATVTTVDTTGASSTTNAYGYTTAAQADAIVASLNAVIAAAKTTGLIAT